MRQDVGKMKRDVMDGPQLIKDVSTPSRMQKVQGLQ